MKTNFLKSILFFVLTAGILTSCVNDDDYNTPSLEDFDCIAADSLVATKTVKQIIEGATALPVLYTANDIIEAYVVSSDKGGNFFKTMHLQTKDSTAFTLSLDLANYATHFQAGRRVFIKLKDRYIQIKDGGLLIGELDGSSIFRIPAPLVGKTILRTCELAENDEQFVRRISIEDAIGSNEYLNMLVEFDSVQFVSSAVGQPYHLPANGNSGTNHTITDINGKTIIVRSTSFSKYAVKPVPSQSGKIRGILTRFGTTYQFTPRYESDIMLNQERFYINTQIGGTDIQYLGSFTENFESYGLNTRIFPKYLNDSYTGGRYWEVKQFPANTGNKYIQMTSNGSNEINRTLFYVPVDMTAANTLSFKTKDGFNNGNVLKVWYTTNYTPGTDLSNATLVDITSQFTISSGTTSGYAQNFTNSGVYNIPASVTGNGFFIFEYSGNGAGSALTTTIQVDDITVN